MLGDGDGTMRFQNLNYLYGQEYAYQYYHDTWSIDINDYPESEWLIELIGPQDIHKLGHFMYMLRDIKISGKALRGLMCSAELEEEGETVPEDGYGIDFTGSNRRRLQNLPSFTDLSTGNIYKGGRYADGFYLGSHAHTSQWIEDSETDPLFVTSPSCPEREPEPDDEEGECDLWMGDSYTRAFLLGAINSTTTIYNVFDGEPLPGNFMGYAYINGPIRVELTGRYYPNSRNCDEERERRSDYLIIGNIIRKPESGGPIYTPGTLTHSTGTRNLFGITFAEMRARSTVYGGGAGGYARNDYTGTWEEPDVSGFRFWN